jgi:hypothetical protein
MNVTIKMNIVVLVVAVVVFLFASVGNAQAIYEGVPEKIDVKAKYLFYLHGRIIEEQGIRPTSEKFGVYEYGKILDTLKNKGFIVISEARKGNTGVGPYAQKIASQVETLVKAGVPPSNITVCGASKGGLIAMIISSTLPYKEINYVFLASCVEAALYRFDIALHGNILSIYDEKDDSVCSCQKFVDKSPDVVKFKEVVLKVGTGHGIVYKPLEEWVDRVVEWAKGKR